MPVERAESEFVEGIAPEDEVRSHVYKLLAHFLADSPDKPALDAAAAMEGDETALGKAVSTFSHICARTEPEQVAQEFHDLFIGVGRGELLPFASYYLTGFLNEKPLAKLRNDMAQLGIQREEGVKEPEDHIAALLDIMAGLITGSFGKPASLDEQKRFFETHIRSWAGHFFVDLESAKSSVLYATLGTIGRVFMEIEDAAFSMD